MPDIRRTGLIDDFERPDENPIQLPWLDASNSVSAGQLRVGNYQGVGAGGCRAFWTPRSFSGDVECWAMAVGSPGLGFGWRLGLMFNPDPSLPTNGYEVLPHNNGPLNWALRTIVNGGTAAQWTASQVDVGTGMSQGDLLLIRTRGTQVQVFHSGDDGDNWIPIFDVTDQTYRSGLYLAVGTTGNETGWSAVGGGVLGPPLIPQMIRPWDRRPRRVG